MPPVSVTVVPWRKCRKPPAAILSLAYQVFGDGPVDLVFAGSFVSQVELFWTMPEFEAFFEPLATFCRATSGPGSSVTVALNQATPSWMRARLIQNGCSVNASRKPSPPISFDTDDRGNGP